MTKNKKILLGCLSPFIVLFLFILVVVIATKDEKVDKNAPVDEQVKTIVKNEQSPNNTIKNLKFNNGTVFLSINAKDHSGSKKGLLWDASRLLDPISKINGVKAIHLTFYAPLTDQYGKQTNEKVMFIDMEQETLDRIEWDNFDYDNIPTIADVYKQHSAYD